MGKKSKVLFLSAWYPNRYDAMAGLFVRKHAQSIVDDVDVCVLYLHIDNKISTVDIEQNITDGLREIVVYVPFAKNFFVRVIRFLKGFFCGYSLVQQTFGKPDITQVNVLTRNGVLAYWLKLTQKIPYIIVEHWSRYLPENFCYRGFWRRKVTEFVVSRAEKIMTVSNVLKKAMQQQNIRGDYEVVYNVVDDEFFKLRRRADNTPKRILHISCFDDKNKNISGILQATKMLSAKRKDFELVVVGTGPDYQRVIEFANELKFPPQMVRFTSEQTPMQVAEWLAESDIFVLFSMFETAGVVVMESLAAGVPVIATNTGIVPDFINSTNGAVVEFDDTEALSEAINCMLDNLDLYNRTNISNAVQCFSRQSVAKQFLDVYNQILCKPIR